MIPGIGTNAGPAAPYPNTLEVSGVTDAATDVNVRLIDLTHRAPDDLDILLQHPLGQTAILMSDVGGITNIPAVTLTLDDEATTPLPNDSPLTSGPFLPTNISPNDTWPSPAPSPVASGNTRLSTFDGASPNGTWRLFILDDLSLNGAMGRAVRFSSAPNPQQRHPERSEPPASAVEGSRRTSGAAEA